LETRICWISTKTQEEASISKDTFLFHPAAIGAAWLRRCWGGWDKKPGDPAHLHHHDYITGVAAAFKTNTLNLFRWL
jgi:hypothetical protein